MVIMIFHTMGKTRQEKENRPDQSLSRGAVRLLLEQTQGIKEAAGIFSTTA